ncbi:hypothetical protein V8E51_002762 [Hyaloscypha variabilis]
MRIPPRKSCRQSRRTAILHHHCARAATAPRLGICEDTSHSQGWDEPQVKIFMGLKEGTLESLVESGADASAVANSAYPQMLRALDCIAWKGIIYRDVKPENILYISQPDGQYQFQLGDFRLCNRIIDAATFAGTYLYMPPEMLQEGDRTHR